MFVLAFLLGWGITSTCTVVEVEGRAVCLQREELQPRKAASGPLWGWNEDGHRTELELGYSVEGVSPARREMCVEAIRRWGGGAHGICIHVSEKPPGVERTLVFTEEPFQEPTLALGTAEFPWTGGPSSRIRINSNADWSRYSLLHVLVHEVGHALGFPHTHDPDSVMRPYHTGQERPGWSDLVRASQLYLTRPWPAPLAAGR